MRKGTGGGRGERVGEIEVVVGEMVIGDVRSEERRVGKEC